MVISAAIEKRGIRIMKSSNRDAIQQAFTQQAGGFESSQLNFTRQDYLDHIVSVITPLTNDSVLEVAAGTCVCGRAIAPYAQNVVCLDMTPAMLSVGKAEAEKADLHNITFVLGDAAGIPFLESSFDLVISRLAFHHFPDVRQVFAEMVRVLKPGGRLVLIDMEAAKEPLRQVQDEIETLRDPSHVKNLSMAEMQQLFADYALQVVHQDVTSIQQHLTAWMALTKTPQAVQEEITMRMESELHGGAKTGFAPYRVGNEICFDHRWVLLIGQK